MFAAAGTFAPAQSGLTGTVTLQKASDATQAGSYAVHVTQAATKASATIDTSGGITAGDTITIGSFGNTGTYTVQSGDTAPVDGEGHVHVKVDGEYMDATADTTYTLSGLTSGPHTLSVVLAGNDHTESAVSDSVSVTTYVPTISIVLA